MTMNDLIIPAVVFLPHVLQQSVTQVSLKLPDGNEKEIFMAAEGPHYTAFDEAANAYFNYTLNDRAASAAQNTHTQAVAELYDMNASRRLIALVPQMQIGHYAIEDTVAQSKIELVVKGPEITLLVDGESYAITVLES